MTKKIKKDKEVVEPVTTLAETREPDFHHEFTYEISYVHTNMTGKLLNLTDLDEFQKEKPRPGFVSALNYFCQRFYPSVDLDEKNTPWLKHNLKDQARKTWIDGLKKNNWPLSWYWKALLSVAHLYPKRQPDETWYVCLSQVRKWNMVVVYSEKRVGEKTVRKLLRPPLFGESDHLLREDAYFSLATKEHQFAIEKAWKNIQEDRKEDLITEEECHVEKWYVIGRHDMIYRIGDVQFPDTKKMHISVSPKLELHPFVIKKFKTKGLPDLENVRRPYDFIEVPIHQNRGGDNDSAKIILSSDHMCQALAEASEVWNDNTAESVLLISPPGTGKEILAETLYEFRRFYGKYVSSALVPGASEYNQKLLCFNAKTDSGGKETPDEDRETPDRDQFERHFKEEMDRMQSAQNKKERLKKEAVDLFDKEEKEKDATKKRELLEQFEKKEIERKKTIPPITPCKDYLEKDGLILRSRGGLLFLDEIDKVEGSDRAGLLRLLENKEFAFYQGTRVFNLKKSYPLVVFAGSMSRKEMFSKKPRDFWTRITHVIEMKHPLEIKDERQRLRAYSDYFVFFWQNHLPKFFIGSGLKCEIIDYLPLSEKKSEEFLVSYYQDIYRVLMNDVVVYNLGKIFAEEAASGNNMVSLGVRHIRSIVSRTVFALVELVLYDKRSKTPLGHIAKEDLFRYEFAKKDWTERLTWLLGNQKLPKYDPFFDDNNNNDKEEPIDGHMCERYQMREELVYLRQSVKDEIISIIAEAIRKVCFS